MVPDNTVSLTGTLPSADHVRHLRISNPEIIRSRCIVCTEHKMSREVLVEKSNRNADSW